MKTEPDTMRFRLCSLLRYSGGRGKLRFLRTEMPLQDIPVLRSAYFPKKLFSFFSKTLDLQVRFALPPMPHRNVFSKHSGVTVGLFSEKALQLFLQNARPSGSLRSPSDAAPKCFFKTFRCYGRLIFRKSSSAFSPKRSTFRFASLSLRWAGEASLPPCTPLSCPRRTRTDGQAESALDWVGRETARAAGGGAMRPRSGRRHGEAGRAVYLCGVRKGRMGGPEGVRGSRSAPGLPRRSRGGANRPPVKPTHRPRTEKAPFSVRGPAIICVRNNR